MQPPRDLAVSSCLLYDQVDLNIRRHHRSKILKLSTYIFHISFSGLPAEIPV